MEDTNENVPEQNNQVTREMPVQVMLGWESVDYYHNEKTSDWYWALGIIVVTLAVVFFFFNNVFFGIFVLVAGFALGVHGWAKPRNLQYKITKKGVIVDDRLYPYENIISFYIENLRHAEHIHPSVKSMLLFKLNKGVSGIISIPISPEVNIDKLHSVLSGFVGEEEIVESAWQRLLDRLGY